MGAEGCNGALQSFHSSEESEAASASRSINGGATALLLLLAARPPREGADGLAGEEGKEEEAGRWPFREETSATRKNERNQVIWHLDDLRLGYNENVAKEANDT